MSLEHHRPPSGNLDPAIKAVTYLAGALLTMEIVGLGVTAHQPETEPRPNVSQYIPQARNEYIHAAHPIKLPTGPDSENIRSTSFGDYLVPGGMVALETSLAWIAVRRYKASKHPFNKPFLQPDIEYYPLNEEERKAFEVIRSHLDT